MEKLLSKREVLEKVGNPSSATLWRWERAGVFPKRRLIGFNRVAWLESEIEEWIRDAPEAGSSKE